MDLAVWKRAKKEKHLGYEDIARLSGVPITTVKNVFCGYTVTPRIDTVEAIERALGIRPTLEWTEEDRAAGMADSVQITVNAEMFEWNELGERIIAVKGEEFFKTLKKMLEASLEK